MTTSRHPRRLSYLNHLKDDEIAEIVDGSGRRDADRMSHVRSCVSCRDRVQELREVMLEVSELGVPEPSPLFWDHLAKRVSDAIRVDGSAPGRRHRAWRWSLSHVTTAIATGVVVLAVVAGWGRLDFRSDSRSAAETVIVGDVSEGSASEVARDGVVLEAPADWALLLAMTDSVEWAVDDADLLMVERRAISATWSELTTDERRVVVELIAAELEGGELW